MRPEKTAIVKEIQEQVTQAGFVILTDFTKMNTVKTGLLKAKLREQQAGFQVVPNRLFRVSLTAKCDGLRAGLKGPTAVVYGSGDAAATAKSLSEFIKTNEKLPVIKLGLVDGKILSAAEVEIIASLPSKKVMQGMLVGTIAAPMSGLVGVLSQKLASVLYVLKAALEKKQEAAA